MSDALQDAEARRAICEDTHRTLFVEAGAGSGKTKSLVDRIHRLVVHDGVPLRSIAAVTFTEKAGAELRDRLRATLEQETDERAEEALDDLDGAAIGTLHSFAQRILAEHPIEAGLPPLIEVADELSSAVAFEERWAEQRRRLLDDDAIAEPLLLAMSAGVTLEHLRSLAKLFNADWDLVAERVLTDEELTGAELTGVEELAERAALLAARADECTSVDDKFLNHLTAFGAWGASLTDASDAGLQLQVLRAAADLKFSYGQAGNWGGKSVLDALKTDCKDVATDAAGAVAAVLEPTLRALSRWIAARVLEAAEERRSAGRLEFHDLLVIAREVLRGDDGAPVRAALQQRYQRLLLDEFQDTDPIQIELAVRIAGGAEATAERWEDVAIPAGSLFVVGDPKQSIYRFRRADIAMYLRSQKVIGEHISLDTNFRTVAPVVEWVNGVFSQLITAEPDRQPAFQSLVPHRGERPGKPAVVVLGAEPHQGLPRSHASILREREAADVAGVIQRAVAEGWPVCVDDVWRPARLDDVAILVPARTSLPFLETALDRAGIAYRAESSSLVYEAQEVRDLLAAVRAIADPSDALALVTALRSPLFGCGDDDLWTWKHDGGALNVIAPVDDDRSDHPVARALGYLRRLHYDSRWMTPSEVLTRLVADRRMLEVAAHGPRARDQWRRLRFVVDQARAWSESEHGGLRAYLTWAQQQGEETSRVVEAALPETDAEAVRIMTVHGAKGLEFPIVVMSGMTAGVRHPSGVKVLWTADGYEVSLRKGVTTGDFDAAAPIDEQMDDRERRRLLYVAATRARDHLVVSLHRSATSTAKTSAKLLVEGEAVARAESWSVDQLTAGSSSPPAKPLSTPPDRDTWLAELTAVRSASRRTSAISASGLEGSEPAVALPGDDAEAGAAKGALNLDLPPWSKGRYGTAIGRAVHAVLQSIDLATEAGLAEAVTAQSVAEGVESHADVVSALVQSALSSELVQRAAAQEHWREMYVGAVQDDTVLEGYVDLIYREDDGSLVVLDYKTDAIPAGALPTRVAHYRPQITGYATMLTAAGATVSSPSLLFLSLTEATAVPVAPR